KSLLSRRRQASSSGGSEDRSLKAQLCRIQRRAAWRFTRIKCSSLSARRCLSPLRRRQARKSGAQRLKKTRTATTPQWRRWRSTEKCSWAHPVASLGFAASRSEEHTSELQSRFDL